MERTGAPTVAVGSVCQSPTAQGGRPPTPLAPSDDGGESGGVRWHPSRRAMMMAWVGTSACIPSAVSRGGRPPVAGRSVHQRPPGFCRHPTPRLAMGGQGGASPSIPRPSDDETQAEAPAGVPSAIQRQRRRQESPLASPAPCDDEGRPSPQHPLPSLLLLHGRNPSQGNSLW